MPTTAAAPATTSPGVAASSAAPTGVLTVVLYVVGAYAWTWSFNLVKILGQRGVFAVALPDLLLDVAAGLGPLLAAFAAVSLKAGGGRRALLSQLLRWRVPRRWYAIAVLGPVGLVLAAYGLWVAAGGAPPPAEALAQWPLVPVFFVYILLACRG